MAPLAERGEVGAEGDLEGARGFLRRAGTSIEPTALVAYLATYRDLVWVLDAGQIELLRRLTPAAFDDDQAVWALCQAQASYFAGDTAGAREYAERARAATEEQLRGNPGDPQLRAQNGIALAYAGRKEGAIREGERAVEMRGLDRDAVNGAYFLHQLVRIQILTGEHEKAIDTLEKLLKIPYYVTPAWLKIDPNFDPLRKNPRFQKLVAKGK